MIWICFVHNIFGILIGVSISINKDLDGFEYVNPVVIYDVYRVNYFGCFCLTILYNLICPIASICYWFYKLCTVGRRH